MTTYITSDNISLKVMDLYKNIYDTTSPLSFTEHFRGFQFIALVCEPAGLLFW